MPDIRVSHVSHLEPFEFRWPEGTEAFEGGWAYTAEIGGARHAVRHGMGAREVYGRIRVHTVTWIGEVQVEGVEADDYPVSQSLLSRLRRSGRALASTMEQVPAGYEPFEIVEHRREIPACREAHGSEFSFISFSELAGDLPGRGDPDVVMTRHERCELVQKREPTRSPNDLRMHGENASASHLSDTEEFLFPD